MRNILKDWVKAETFTNKSSLSWYSIYEMLCGLTLMGITIFQLSNTFIIENLILLLNKIQQNIFLLGVYII